MNGAKIEKRWKIATNPTKNPIIKEKSRSFCQSLFFTIIKVIRQKTIKKAKLTNPAPLAGVPHKLLDISKENKVDIKTVKKKPNKEINGKKRYFGNASVVAKGENIHVEGFDLQLEKEDITIHERLIEMKQALQSSISYAGGKDLNCFKDVDFCVIQKQYLTLQRIFGKLCVVL